MSCIDDLERLLQGLPRFPLVVGPTPLTALRRLSKRLGIRLFIKRDDLTGLAFGGNKVRQAEFFIGEALSQNADVVVAGGNVAQSNHSRIISAAARAGGLLPVILVRPGGRTEGGNATIVRLLAHEVRGVPELAGISRDRLGEVSERRPILERVADEYASRGLRPYVLPGSSIPLGVAGYLSATLELERQFAEYGISPDWIFITSTGASQAGLELGQRVLGTRHRIVGIAYEPTAGRGARWVSQLSNGLAERLGLALHVDEHDVINDDSTSGGSYGDFAPEARAALRVMAEDEAILLDPVYSSKGMAGLLDWVASGRVQPGETVVFIHTGGQPALFAFDADAYRA